MVSGAIKDHHLAGLSSLLLNWDATLFMMNQNQGLKWYTCDVYLGATLRGL
jgi:hypothetical protein